MKCSNCGYEFEKPSQKTCPLCGHKVTRISLVTDEESIPQEQTSNDFIEAEAVSSIDASPSVSPTVKTEPAPVTLECPICHTKVSEDTNFCPHCGHDMHFNAIEEPNEETVSLKPIESAVEEMVAHEEQDVITDAELVAEQEITPISNHHDNYRDEDGDEYIENGAYVPDSEEDSQQWTTESTPQSERSSVSQSLILIITAILSIALGAAIYCIF